MERKFNEFLDLTQGTDTVLQYAQKFNNLCQYAGYQVDTNRKKRDCFRHGLNTKLKERLNPIKVDTYYELVNLAITQEDCIMAHRAEKKRKVPTIPSSASPQRYHLVQTATPQIPQKAPQQGRWVFKPPLQQEHIIPPIPEQNSARPSASSPICPNSTNNDSNCGDPNHFTHKCPPVRRPSRSQSSGQNKRNKGKKPTVQVRQGEVNSTSLADLPEGASVMMGIFSIHHKSVVILFDFGASHSFICA